ncbi:ATP-binding protein [Streptomyces sp. NPDC101152]|uniref:ATP-binding protein n=1 Tax=Streptomyces sp. NPDC101152 TaxID=3366116 RepID=UPI00381EB2BE
MDCTTCMPRKRWDLPFFAEPEQVAGVRRALRRRLGGWGLHAAIDAAQLRVSELVSNVINHVGPGVPVTLSVSMHGTRLRLELRDPDSRALPTLVEACTEAESGRGLTLISAVTERWGVRLLADAKVTWCELATGLSTATGHCGDPQVSRAEQVLDLYCEGRLPPAMGASMLRAAVTEGAVIDIIADLLHWLRVHGSTRTKPWTGLRRTLKPRSQTWRGDHL